MDVLRFPQLHYSWRIYRSAPAQVRHILQSGQQDLGWGAFSIVFPVDDFTVLKLSTCEASKTILPTLVNNPTPGLPLVYKAFGQVGEVIAAKGLYDTIPVHAYLMERLWTPSELPAKPLRTDACPRGSMMVARTLNDAIGAYNWLRSKLYGQDAWAAEAHVPEGRTTVHPLLSSVYEALAHTRFKPLIGLVRRLSPRVLSGEWTFDWIDRYTSNVLLSQWGEPLLADPVYNLNQVSWKRAYSEFDPDS